MSQEGSTSVALWLCLERAEELSSSWDLPVPVSLRTYGDRQRARVIFKGLREYFGWVL